MSYFIDPFSIRFTQTDCGINATGTIVHGKRRIGTIHDLVVRVITDVSFIAEKGRVVFNAEARQSIATVCEKANASGCAFICEYARELLHQAEKKLLSSSLMDHCSGSSE